MSQGLNISQLPKTRGFLENWRARPGHRLVQLDLTAIEPTVLAEYSKDATLWKLYGPQAVTNDVYLYNAAHFPMFAEEVRRYYDPERPTPESIALAKKACKRTRNINKTVHLAKQYFAGTKKIYSTLLEEEVDTTYEETEGVCQSWDQLYTGVKRFNDQLLAEWEFNGGWIYNGVFRPIAVHESRVKDLVNSFCQSSGHDVLLLLLEAIERRRLKSRLKMYPWIVDFHDETIWEVPTADAEGAAELLTLALADVNAELQPEIPIKGSPTICDNLAEIKVED